MRIIIIQNGALLIAMLLYPDHFHFHSEDADANWKKVDKALELFHKWFFNLWN